MAASPPSRVRVPWPGEPPQSRTEDWVVYVQNTGGAQPFSLDVGFGTGSGSYAAGEVANVANVAGTVVNLVADAPPNGQVFDQWTGDTTEVADINAASTTLTMPAGDVTITATFEAEPTPVEYLLTVNGGSGSGSYTAGTVVNLVADAPPNGQVFDQWTGDTTEVADINAASTTLTMPAGDATVTATYRTVSSGGTFSFGPTDDAFLQGSTRFNDAYLKVEAGYRVSYLKFNVSGLSGNVQRATLRLQENGDLGSGTVRVYRGSHNGLDGNDARRRATRRLENGQVGLTRGAVGSGQVVSVDVSSWITGNGTYTAIVKRTPAGTTSGSGRRKAAASPN